MANYWENLSVGKKIKFVLTIILSVFVIVFAVINWKTTPVDFVFIDFNISLTLLIIICLLVGYLIASLFESKHYNGKVKEITLLNNEIEALKADKNELKVQLKNLENAAVTKPHNSFDNPTFDSPEQEII